MIKLIKQNKGYYISECKNIEVEFKKSTVYCNYSVYSTLFDIKKGFNTLKEVKKYVNNIKNYKELVKKYDNIKKFLDGKGFFSSDEIKIIMNNPLNYFNNLISSIKYIEKKDILRLKKQFVEGKQFFKIDDKIINEMLDVFFQEQISSEKRDINILIKDIEEENKNKNINYYTITNNLKTDELRSLSKEMIAVLKEYNFIELKKELEKLEFIRKESITKENIKKLTKEIIEQIKIGDRAKKEQNKKINYTGAINELSFMFQFNQFEILKDVILKCNEKRLYDSRKYIKIHVEKIDILKEIKNEMSR